MSNLTILQRKQSSKNLIPIIIGTVILGGFALIFILRGGSSVEGPEAFSVSKEETILLQKEAKNILQSVSIPDELFANLREFDLYEPIQLKEAFGKANPFVTKAISDILTPFVPIPGEIAPEIEEVEVIIP